MGTREWGSRKGLKLWHLNGGLLPTITEQRVEDQSQVCLQSAPCLMTANNPSHHIIENPVLRDKGSFNYTGTTEIHQASPGQAWTFGHLGNKDSSHCRCPRWWVAVECYSSNWDVLLLSRCFTASETWTCLFWAGDGKLVGMLLLNSCHCQRSFVH